MGPTAYETLASTRRLGNAQQQDRQRPPDTQQDGSLLENTENTLTSVLGQDVRKLRPRARGARAEEGAAAAADNRTALLAQGKQFQEAAALLPRSAPQGGSGVPEARPHACAQDCAFIKS